MLKKAVDKYRRDGFISLLYAGKRHLRSGFFNRIEIGKRIIRSFQRPEGTQCSAFRYVMLRIYSIAVITVTGGGQSVTQRDWDNLVILDACRYDMYEELNTIPGDLSSIRSVGSNTTEFLRRTFEGGEYADTIYISANVHPSHRVNAEFHQVFHLWDEHWDDTLDTVRPEDTVKESIRLAEEYPEKKLIIHFLQPHYPFIGELGQAYHASHGHKRGRSAENVWVQLARGEVSKNTIKTAYWENLEVTLPSVEQLVSTLDGKTVITSDHGNALGERGLYGHAYAGIYIDSLRKVPWHVVSADGRKRTVAEDTADGDDEFEEDVVQDRLEQLGYVDR